MICHQCHEDSCVECKLANTDWDEDVKDFRKRHPVPAAPERPMMKRIAESKENNPGGLRKSDTLSDALARAASLASPDGTRYSGLMGSNKDLRRLVLLAREVRELSRLREENERLNRLVYAVANKYPGESRFDTALRYIRQAESRPSQPAAGGRKE